jgi:hypothetical protein
MYYTLCPKNNGGIAGDSASKYTKGNTMDVGWILLSSHSSNQTVSQAATRCHRILVTSPTPQLNVVLSFRVCVCGRLVVMFTPQEKAWCVLLLAEHKLVITVQRAFRRELRKILHMRITLDDAFISFKKRVAFQNRQEQEHQSHQMKLWKMQRVLRA